MHTAVIILWAGSMALFELSHFVPEKPLYDQGFIVVPHLATLALSIGPGGEITVLYSYFVITALHLICSGILGLGGIYHAIFGPERLEETTYGFVFGYQSQDRFRITAILGAHLLTLGCGAFLLFVKACYLGGVYDTWACGGGDIRLLRGTELSLNPLVLGHVVLLLLYIHGTITLHIQVNSMDLQDQKLLKHKALHFWYVIGKWVWK